MTSQLNVDTIVDKAGSGGTNVKIGNTSTYVADGGSATQNTVQGLAKAWVRYKTTSTAAVDDSFNISGINDTGTGVTTISFSNNMGNSTFSVGMVAGQDEAFIKFRSPATGSWVVSTANPSSSGTDFERLGGNVFGDLA